MRFIQIDSNCGLNLFRSCLIFGDRCWGTSAITSTPFSYCQTSILTCRCASIHNRLREDFRNFPPQISLTRSPWSKKYRWYMLLSSVSSEKLFLEIRKFVSSESLFQIWKVGFKWKVFRYSGRIFALEPKICIVYGCLQNCTPRNI